MTIKYLTMEAWTLKKYGRVEDLSLLSLPLLPPAAGHVIIRVEAVALNPLDLKLIAGDLQASMQVSFPFVPGSDVCGRVVAVGEGVLGLKDGDRVVALTPAFGALANYVSVPVGPTTVKAPLSMSASDLAALPEAGLTAIDVLRAADLKEGMTAAIVGASGGIGLYLCQLASQAGVHVVATASPVDEAHVRACGAQTIIDYATVDGITELQRLFPAGVDVVVDLIHQSDALLQSARAVRSGGRLVSTLVGPPADQFPGSVDVRYVRLSPQPGDLERLVEATASGSLRTSVSQTFSFKNAPYGLLALRDEHVRGKITVET